MGISFGPIYQMNQKTVGFEWSLESDRCFSRSRLSQKALGSYNPQKSMGIQVSVADKGAAWNLGQVLLGDSSGTNS